MHNDPPRYDQLDPAIEARVDKLLPQMTLAEKVGQLVQIAPFQMPNSDEFAKLLQHWLLFYVVVYFFRDGHHRSRLIWGLVSALAIVSVYGIYQFVGLIGCGPTV